MAFAECPSCLSSIAYLSQLAVGLQFNVRSRCQDGQLQIAENKNSTTYTPRCRVYLLDLPLIPSRSTEIAPWVSRFWSNRDTF